MIVGTLIFTDHIMMYTFNIYKEIIQVKKPYDLPTFLGSERDPQLFNRL